MRVLVVTLLAGLALAVAASAEPSAQPAVAVVDRTPITVRGTGFGARERVRVTVSSGVRDATQRTMATYRGSFVVRFDGLRLPCADGTVVATGARGHIARLKLALRECPGPAVDP